MFKKPEPSRKVGFYEISNGERGLVKQKGQSIRFKKYARISETDLKDIGSEFREITAADVKARCWVRTTPNGIIRSYFEEFTSMK